MQRDTTQYTTEQAPRQGPYLGDYTCMPRSCPKCGAKETWLSDPSYVGGRGYLRSWRCEHCSHTEQAEYSQYREMFWAFAVPHAGQLTAALLPACPGCLFLPGRRRFPLRWTLFQL